MPFRLYRHLHGLGFKLNIVVPHHASGIQVDSGLHPLLSTQDSRGQLATPVPSALYRWIVKHEKHASVLPLKLLVGLMTAEYVTIPKKYPRQFLETEFCHRDQSILRPVQREVERMWFTRWVQGRPL